MSGADKLSSWRGRRGKLWIQRQLAREFGNKEWFNIFLVSNQAFLAKRGSDHMPVLIKLTTSQHSYRESFRFDKHMLHKPLVQEAIHQAWNLNVGKHNDSVATHLRHCRKVLSRWKRENQTNSKERITKLQDELETEQYAMDPSFLCIGNIRIYLMKANRDEENFWKQKRKYKWIINGDGNTKVFHAAVKAAQTRNEVVKLIDPDGITHRIKVSKPQVAINYFQEPFKSSSSEDYNEVLRGFPSRVTEKMNHHLTTKVFPEEVKNVVFSIKVESAPNQME